MKQKDNMMENIEILLETEKDFANVENLTREAFWNVNVPACDEHYLVHLLRKSSAFIPELDFILKKDDKIIGNIMYSKAKLVNQEKVDQVITFGPVSIHPDYQGQGYGSYLIKYSLEKARELAYQVVIIYGDPDYYRRFSFLPGEKYDIYSSDGYYNPALQVLGLNPNSLDGLSGSFMEDEVFALDSEDVAEFDKKFPPKEIKESLSQKKFQKIISQIRKRNK